MAVAFALITSLHIVVGELAPKGIALQKPEATALWVAAPLRIFYRLFRWPINALNAVGNGVLRLVGLQVTSGHEMVHSSEELRLLVNARQEAGEVEASEARIAARAFRFADVTAGEMMTPRSEVVAIAMDAPLEDVLEAARRAGHTRLPVYKGSLDEVIGVLSVASLLTVAGSPSRTASLAEMLRPAALIPMTLGADDVLENMRQGGFEFAIVLDEYGVTVGVITLHDILEALVGRVGAGGPRAIGRPLPDRSRLFDGLVGLGEMEEVTGLRLPRKSGRRSTRSTAWCSASGAFLKSVTDSS